MCLIGDLKCQMRQAHPLLWSKESIRTKGAAVKMWVDQMPSAASRGPHADPHIPQRLCLLCISHPFNINLGSLELELFYKITL